MAPIAPCEGFVSPRAHSSDVEHPALPRAVTRGRPPIGESISPVALITGKRPVFSARRSPLGSGDTDQDFSRLS
jgi:hypothetical protein